MLSLLGRAAAALERGVRSLKPKPRRYDFPDAHRRPGKVRMPVEAAGVPAPTDFPGGDGSP